VSVRAASHAVDLGVAVAALLVVVATLIFPAVPQPEGYWPFADQRTLLGTPNALDVLSNAAFAVVGAFGLWRTLRRDAHADARDRAAWLVLFGAVAATSVGSAYFHLAPSDGRLVWDRLPMAAGFMAIAALLVGERFGPAAGRRLLPWLVAGGIATVAWWSFRGNLLPYLVVQYGTMAIIPVLLVGRPHGAAPRLPFVAALVLYALAKVLEAEDRPVFAALGVSGHTLKHLVAAAAIGVLAVEIHRRGRSKRGGSAR
jgi:hypothetical protein